MVRYLSVSVPILLAMLYGDGGFGSSPRDRDPIIKRRRRFYPPQLVGGTARSFQPRRNRGEYSIVSEY